MKPSERKKAFKKKTNCGTSKIHPIVYCFNEPRGFLVKRRLVKISELTKKKKSNRGNAHVHLFFASAMLLLIAQKVIGSTKGL